MRREFGSNVSALCDFYRFYYWRNIGNADRFALSKKSRVNFRFYYYPDCPAYAPDENLALMDVYERAVTSLDFGRVSQNCAIAPALMDFMQRDEITGRERARYQTTRLLRHVTS